MCESFDWTNCRPMFLFTSLLFSLHFLTYKPQITQVASMNLDIELCEVSIKA